MEVFANAKNRLSGNINDDINLLVVGPPRGGFTLLISVLNHLVQDGIIKIGRDLGQTLVNIFVPVLGEFVNRASSRFFGGKLGAQRYIYNGEFKLLVGGPKWLDTGNNDLVCIRKYIGIKDHGDFLMVTSHPKCVLDYYDVVHSHNPLPWTKDRYYCDYKKFASIRNPVGIINSSVFSINALTSEYIQRCTEHDAETIRRQLALYKLSDLKFFEGLVSWLKDYFDEFMRVKNDFCYLMRWEDLLTCPVKTIIDIAEAAGAEISNTYSRKLWAKLAYRNLTVHHKHNFRKGAGVVGDWKNYLTNTHLEILKNRGFSPFLKEFGYDEIWELDEAQYTPFQKAVQDYLDHGKVFSRENVDRNIFTFAYNKSNLAPSGTRSECFTSYPKRKNVEILRSTFRDEAMLQEFLDLMEDIVGVVNRFLYSILELSGADGETALDLLIQLSGKYRKRIEAELLSDEVGGLDSAFKRAEAIVRAQRL